MVSESIHPSSVGRLSVRDRSLSRHMLSAEATGNEDLIMACEV